MEKCKYHKDMGKFKWANPDTPCKTCKYQKILGIYKHCARDLHPMTKGWI